MRKLSLYMLGVLIALPAFAHGFTYEYEGQTLAYSIISEADKTCRTRSGSSDGMGFKDFAGNSVSGELIIPSIAKDGENEYKVVEIGDLAFTNCTELTSVTIPNSVTTIGNKAFHGCDGLTTAIIPNSVTSIGDYAFSQCRSLTSVNIPNSLTSISRFAFLRCSSLTSVTIPGLVTSIGSSAFMGCTGLTSVVIPNSVTSIGYQSFRECSGLTSVSIGCSVTSIDDYAFYKCSSLASVAIPNSVVTIGNYAFWACDRLSSIKFGANLQSIGAFAFRSCSPTDLVIPPSVENIGASAFGWCTELKSIAIGYGIKKIGSEAFDWDRELENIYVTAVTPPEASDKTFSKYEMPLWLVNQTAFDNYSNAPQCWSQFRNNMKQLKQVNEVSVDKTSISGKPGDEIKLTASIKPADAMLPYVFWKSTRPDLVSVDNEGNVTFLEQRDTSGEGSAEECKIIVMSMYEDVPLVEINVNVNNAGIEDVVVDNNDNGNIDFNETVEVYNLTGMYVGNSVEGLAHGFYIVRQGRNVRKISVK